MRALLPPAALLAVLLAPACSDPVHDKSVSDLGAETPGIPKGPRHRAGQPCLVCHGGSGPGNAVFSFAGTVYQTADAKIALENAVVLLIDSASKKHEVATNCVGNFFVMENDYAPAWPVWTKVVFGFVPTPAGNQPVDHPMGSPIYREGSCAKCHGEKTGTESVGHVYFSEPGSPGLPPPSCNP